ncbi:hypothetical protein LXL04_035511 [Taraxacum kok-saghyz]
MLISPSRNCDPVVVRRWYGGGASVVQCADGCRWCTDGGPAVVRRWSDGGPVVGAGGGPVVSNGMHDVSSHLIFEPLLNFYNCYPAGTPKPLTFSKNRLRRAKNRSNTSLLHVCKNLRKKSFFREKISATGLVFERFLASRSRFFEKVNGLGVLGKSEYTDKIPKLRYPTPSYYLWVRWGYGAIKEDKNADYRWRCGFFAFSVLIWGPLNLGYHAICLSFQIDCDIIGNRISVG